MKKIIALWLSLIFTLPFFLGVICPWILSNDSIPFWLEMAFIELVIAAYTIAIVMTGIKTMNGTRNDK